MAIRLMSRKQGVALVFAAATAASVVAVAAPAANSTPPEPTAASVQAKLSELGKQNDQAVEEYNATRIKVDKAKAALKSAQAKAAAAQKKYEHARRVLSLTVAAQYQGGAFSTTGALLSSKDGQSYLDALNALSMMSTHNGQVVQTMDDAKRAAAKATAQANDALAAANKLEKTAAAKKADVEKQVAHYTALLNSLTPVQQTAYVNANTVQTPPANLPAPKGAAGAAVKYALAQVGKPYVFGAAGPGAFDCSGLTMMSWAQAGVSLPHSAAGQYGYGTHVPLSSLQPGDLIFYYSPISHVEIYVGSGMAVSAVEPGVGVKLVTVSSDISNAVGATRL